MDNGVEPKAPLSSWDFSVPQRYEQWDSYKVRSLEPETSKSVIFSNIKYQEHVMESQLQGKANACRDDNNKLT